jgi:hypothetical protein
MVVGNFFYSITAGVLAWRPSPLCRWELCLCTNKFGLTACTPVCSFAARHFVSGKG